MPSTKNLFYQEQDNIHNTTNNDNAPHIQYNRSQSDYELPLSGDQPFNYIPKDIYKKDVSSKPRLYEGRNNRITSITPIMSFQRNQHQQQEHYQHPRHQLQSEQVTSLLYERQHQQQPQRRNHVTTTTAQHALDSHKNGTLSLKEKEEWINNRFHPDHWTMFEACNPHHPSYYAQGRHSQDPDTFLKKRPATTNHKTAASDVRSYKAPSTAPVAGRYSTTHFPVLRKPNVYPLHLSNRLELVTRRPVLSARPLGQKYSINPRWSSNCYGENTIR